MADCTGTMTTAKMMVLRREAQKVSLLKIRTKFWTPTNSAGSGEISRALVKASTNVSPIGMIRNVIIRTPAGSSISRATVPMLLLAGLALGAGFATSWRGFWRGGGAHKETDPSSSVFGRPWGGRRVSRRPPQDCA